MFQKIILENGSRLILAPQEGTQTVTLLVLFGVGSRYEENKINGVSHFIEHLMFKGTKRRPTTLALSKELDGVGAEYNAYTSKDFTGYFIKINHKHLNLACDIISDMLYHSKFDPEELEREKKVIIEEINMYEDNPLTLVEELFEEVVYQGNSLGWLVSGTKETVSGVTRDQMVKYRDFFYRPANTVIGLAGNLGTGVTETVSRYFVSGKVLADLKPIKFEPFKNKQAEPQINLKFKKTEQVPIALGFPGYSYSDPRKYALYALGIILGGNMSSRLFISVRERLGLAYYIRTGINVYQDTGSLVIQAGLETKRADQAIKVILEELSRIKKEGVSAEELKRAQDFFEGKITLELEDSSQLADWYAKQELLTNEILTPEERIKEMFAVSREEVRAVANDLFKATKINLALVGPFKEKAKFMKLLKI